MSLRSTKNVGLRMSMLMSVLFLIGSTASASGIESLASRIMGQQAKQIQFELISNEVPVEKKNEDGFARPVVDVFEIESGSDGKIIIRGNNTISQAVGLNWYLKYVCKTSVSWWADDPIELPETLPSIENKIRKTGQTENRFFLNYCTFGYTMPWWNWHDWERLIDWMALNGVNMPLAITGQEAIWQKVWMQMGLTDLQIRTYFTGPAHLPWHRMSNIDEWSGPLPQSYIDNQFLLQKKILDRQRSLGMTPILPAFAGHVPEALKEISPNSKISTLGKWGGTLQENWAFYLDPSDPLFMKIQQLYLAEQTKHFGTNHIYGVDPFNEVTPPSWEPEYLSKVADTIYTSMTNVDPEAKWFQMTWLFFHQSDKWKQERIKALLRGVSQDKMILLDYYCDNVELWKKTQSFYGQPYIWCYLGNFGGNTNIMGDLKEIEKRMTAVLSSNDVGKLAGIGSTLEAMGVNHIMHEFVFEKNWNSGSIDLDQWISAYAQRRIGGQDKNFEDAWKMMLDDIYVSISSAGCGSVVNMRPSLKGNKQWTTKEKCPYDNAKLFEVWGKMLDSNLIERDSYKQDLVNVALTAMVNHAHVFRKEMSDAFENKDLDQFNKSSVALLGLIRDIDQIAATRSDRLLGKWISDAKTFAADDSEEAFYEHNARNILSTWAQKGIYLTDYANRTWAGLTSEYYLTRWSIYISELQRALILKTKVDQAAIEKKIVDFEWNWTLYRSQLPAEPAGNAVELSKMFYMKYSTIN